MVAAPPDGVNTPSPNATASPKPDRVGSEFLLTFLRGVGAGGVPDRSGTPPSRHLPIEVRVERRG